MKNLIAPILQSRSLTEIDSAPETDIDKMLHEYVKPAFIRMKPGTQQKAIELLKQMADSED